MSCVLTTGILTQTARKWCGRLTLSRDEDVLQPGEEMDLAVNHTLEEYMLEAA